MLLTCSCALLFLLLFLGAVAALHYAGDSEEHPTKWHLPPPPSASRTFCPNISILNDATYLILQPNAAECKQNRAVWVLICWFKRSHAGEVCAADLAGKVSGIFKKKKKYFEHPRHARVMLGRHAEQHGKEQFPKLFPSVLPYPTQRCCVTWKLLRCGWERKTV